MDEPRANEVTGRMRQQVGRSSKRSVQREHDTFRPCATRN
ncbi:hypothetical protein GFS60_07074 (plasmid) [Rhodococcus sp. WAY2]|nr:hypothetical protein GFS60_07074 [Rhodococcus sp. WAY2]